MTRTTAQIVLGLLWLLCVAYMLAVYLRGDIDEATCYKIGGGLLAVLLAICVPAAVADRQASGRQRGFEVRQYHEP